MSDESLKEEILINVTPSETRAALLENGVLQEIFIERSARRGLISNIYNGRISRVLPGMQAAFVDIGLERTAFLHASDIARNGAAGETANEDLPDIRSLVREGDRLLVQVVKDPLGNKGARLTTFITLPSRHLVLLPRSSSVGISARIDQDEERERLRLLVEELLAEHNLECGAIVRTVAEGCSREALEADLEYLVRLWDVIQERCRKGSVQHLVNEDLSLPLRVLRDLVTSDVETILVDSRPDFEAMQEFAATFLPGVEKRLEHYKRRRPIFDMHGIEDEIRKALDRSIPLKSGGYLIFDQTEAMTTIDVNTGAYVGHRNLEETIYKTNLEAAMAIARQLRLRNLGGIIIIDFIDMEQESHREDVFNALQEAVKKDKSRANILKVSEFGLVQMTRKRDRENLSQMMCEPCMYCGGNGFLKSRRSVCYEIFRKISHEGHKIAGDTVTIKVHPSVADLMLKDETLNTENLEKELQKRFIIVADNEMYLEKYEIMWERS